MFSGRPSVRASVRPSVRDSRGSVMFPRYLQYLLTDFRQTFVTGASRGRNELIRFLGRKVKGQGHTIAAEAHSTRRYRRFESSSFSILLVTCELFMRRQVRFVNRCSYHGYCRMERHRSSSTFETADQQCRPIDLPQLWDPLASKLL